MKKSYVRFAVMAVMFLAASMFTVSCGMKSPTLSNDKKTSKTYKKSKNKRMKASEYK